MLYCGPLPYKIWIALDIACLSARPRYAINREEGYKDACCKETTLT